MYETQSPEYLIIWIYDDEKDTNFYCGWWSPSEYGS